MRMWRANDESFSLELVGCRMKWLMKSGFRGFQFDVLDSFDVYHIFFDHSSQIFTYSSDEQEASYVHLFIQEKDGKRIWEFKRCGSFFASCVDKNFQVSGGDQDQIDRNKPLNSNGWFKSAGKTNSVDRSSLLINFSGYNTNMVGRLIYSGSLLLRLTDVLWWMPVLFSLGGKDHHGTPEKLPHWWLAPHTHRSWVGNPVVRVNNHLWCHGWQVLRTFSALLYLSIPFVDLKLNRSLCGVCSSVSSIFWRLWSWDSFGSSMISPSFWFWFISFLSSNDQSRFKRRTAPRWLFHCDFFHIILAHHHRLLEQG